MNMHHGRTFTTNREESGKAEIPLWPVVRVVVVLLGSRSRASGISPLTAAAVRRVFGWETVLVARPYSKRQFAGPSAPGSVPADPWISSRQKISGSPSSSSSEPAALMTPLRRPTPPPFFRRATFRGEKAVPN